jgi:hypothetical protein
MSFSNQQRETLDVQHYDRLIFQPQIRNPMPFKTTKLVHAMSIHSSIDMIVRSFLHSATNLRFVAGISFFLLVALGARTLLARAIWADGESVFLAD